MIRIPVPLQLFEGNDSPYRNASSNCQQYGASVCGREHIVLRLLSYSLPLFLCCQQQRQSTVPCNAMRRTMRIVRIFLYRNLHSTAQCIILNISSDLLRFPFPASHHSHPLHTTAQETNPPFHSFKRKPKCDLHQTSIPVYSARGHILDPRE